MHSVSLLLILTQCQFSLVRIIDHSRFTNPPATRSVRNRTRHATFPITLMHRVPFLSPASFILRTRSGIIKQSKLQGATTTHSVRTRGCKNSLFSVRSLSDTVLCVLYDTSHTAGVQRACVTVLYFLAFSAELSATKPMVCKC